MVDDCLLDIVDGDVVAEDGAGVGVGLLDGRPGKADERGTGKSVAEVAGQAVDQIVLAAVGFIGDYDDVGAKRELRHSLALFGEELLDGGEDHASAGYLEQPAQVFPIRSLDGHLAQQFVAALELAE